MTQRILVIAAHPDLAASKVNRSMLARIADLAGVTVVRLYDVYPDFRIDVRREQEACVAHDVIVLQHPLFWYSAPSLLKEWIDRVLLRGWAYGSGGDALRGKTMLSAVSSNAEQAAYSAVGRNRHTLTDLLAPFRQTAYHCGMSYPAPFAFYGARVADDAAIDAHAERYRAMLRALRDGESGAVVSPALLPGDDIDFG